MFSRVNYVVILVLFSFLQIVSCQNHNDESKFTKFLKCDPEKSSSEKSSECPLNSTCIELGKTNKIDGLCACKENYTVNENYTSTDKSSVYCIERNHIAPTISTTTAPSSSNSTTESIKTTSTLMPANATHLPSSTTTIIPSTKATQISTLSTLAPQTTNATKVEITTVIPSSSPTITKNNTESNSAQPQAHHFLGGILLPLMFVLAFAGIAYAVKKYDFVDRVQNYVNNRRSTGQPHQTRYDGLENDFDDDPLLI